MARSSPTKPVQPECRRFLQIAWSTATIHGEHAARTLLLDDGAISEHHLRRVRRLRTEMAATGHAERLARELGLDA